MHFLPQAIRLDSRLSRRLLLSFSLTIVLPVFLIAYLSLEIISGQLVQQSFDHSQHVSKTIGMELFRQLELASLEMENHLANNRRGTTIQDTEHGTAGNRINSYHYLNTGTKNTSSNGFAAEPVLTDSALRHIQSGNSAIVLDRRSDSNQAEILLVRTAGNHSLIAGKLNKHLLSAATSILDENSTLVVSGPEGEILLDIAGQGEILLEHLGSRVADSISGHFGWDTGEDGKLTSYWSLFTEQGFAIPFLTVSVTQPEAAVLLTVSDFREVYIPALLFAISAVILLSVFRLKYLLKPIAMLSDATRNIARGQFRNDIKIRGNDELAELGEAFNTMSGKLERQFRSLSAIADIDTLILSSFNIDNIVSAVLANVPTLTPCDSAAILMLDEDSSSGALSIRPDTRKETVTTVDTDLSSHDMNILSGTEYLITHGDNCNLQLIESLRSTEHASYLLFPLYLQDRLAAVIILGYNTTTHTPDEELAYLKKFSDHVTVALNNSRWEERMYHQAHHDDLTGLPNRAMLKDRLDQAIKRAERNNYGMSVLFVDIDRFKFINDSLGHTAGDMLLVKIAELLTSSVRSTDTVVRFGGDEFVIIIPDMEIMDDTWPSLATFANTIIEKTSGELTISDRTIRTGISIGISTYPKDGSTTDELIKNADAAMYYAKKDGRARCKFYSAEINDEISRRVQIEQDLYRALENNELNLVYQPKVDCAGGQITGAEALIRWSHPGRGEIYPDDFIHIAEETGLINQIGEWAIQTVCDQLNSWSRSGLEVVPVAVNIAPRHFKERELDDYLKDVLSSTGVTPQLLELEVTEGAVMENTEESIRKLSRLRDMGIKLSIDDFGTGFSSLGYLRTLPVDKLKVDQSFIKDMTDNKNTWAIVSSTIFLAHQLGLEVIAEGVETAAHRDILQHLRCDTLQGYLISRPVDAEDFSKLLTASGPDLPAKDNQINYR